MLTKEHAALRRLGGSDIAAVLGQSRRRTALAVWIDLRIRLRHLGLLPWALRSDEKEPPPLPEDVSNASMERGRFLEPGLRAWASEKLGQRFEWREDWVIQHPTNEWATYSPDGLAADLLELKSPESFSGHEWGEEGTDQVPREYLLQGAWGCYVTDRPRCHFGALLGGELRLYRYERNPKLEAALVEGALGFVENHLLAGIPPEPAYGDANNVFRLHPRANESWLDWSRLRPDQQETLGEWLRLRRAQLDGEKAEESKSAVVRAIIGDAAGVLNVPVELGATRINFSNRVGGFKYTGVVEALAAKFLVAPEEIEAIKQANRSPDTRSLTVTEPKKARK